MSITQINANNSVAILGLPNSSNYAVGKSNCSNEISDEYAESDEISKFKDVVGKYDITNMSSNEVVSMYKELYDNKLIDFKDYMISTFNPAQSPMWNDALKKIEDTSLSSNPNEKINYLEYFKTRVDQAEQYGSSKSKECSKRMLELAEKIHYFQS